MILDQYSVSHSDTDPAALAAFEQAVWNMAAHCPDAAVALTRALEIDPHFVSAHALKGFAGVTLARSETIAAAASDFHRARSALTLRGGTAGEHTLVEALGLAVSGRLLDAASRLDLHLVDAPENFLALKLSHALRFMSGDSAGMLRTTSAALPAWSPSMAGYGFVLGCHAFGLEEMGQFAAAEKLGRRAVAHEATDAWGLHAVAHVCEMQGRTIEGAQWLEAARPIWSQCNNFSYHMGWHLALFRLAEGRVEEALALYDIAVRPIQTDDFRDVANAVSFLTRLEHQGVAVGDRWDGLATLARKRATDASLIFGSLHHLLTLVAVGDLATAHTLVKTLAERADTHRGDQSNVAEFVGRDVACAVLSAAEGAGEHAALGPLAHRLQALGGSNAQRDIFMRTLALIAADAGWRGDFDAVLKAQRQFRRDDRFERLAFARLAANERKVA